MRILLGLAWQRCLPGRGPDFAAVICRLAADCERGCIEQRRAGPHIEFLHRVIRVHIADQVEETLRRKRTVHDKSG